MTFTVGAPPSKRVTAILLLLVLFFWVPGFAAVLAAKACYNPKFEVAKNLRYCNFAIGATRVSVWRWVDVHKASSVYMERGILLANAGDNEGAREDMRRALDMASFGEPQVMMQQLAETSETGRRGRVNWLDDLVSRVQQPDVSSAAQKVWAEVWDAAAQGAETKKAAPVGGW